MVNLSFFTMGVFVIWKTDLHIASHSAKLREG